MKTKTEADIWMDWMGGSYTQVTPKEPAMDKEYMDVLEGYYTAETVKPTSKLIEAVKKFAEDSSYKNFLDVESFFTDIKSNMIRRDCIRCHNKG